MNQKGFIYTGNLLQTVNYYPSGVPFTLTDDDPVTDRLHTGKPFIDMQGLGYYDNNARFLDILTGSFISVDPLAGKYPSLTPYNHCANNSLIFIDPDGRDWIDRNGSIEWHDKISDELKKSDGYQYIGVSNNSLRRYLGANYNLPTLKSNLIGMTSNDAQIGKFAVSHMVNVKETSNVQIDVAVSYDLNNKSDNNRLGISFKGLIITAQGESYNSVVDGKVYSASNIDVEYGNKVYSAPFSIPREDILSTYGTTPKVATINIPVSDISPTKSFSNISIQGNWNVLRPHGSTPIVIHSLIPIPLTYTHKWTF